jgi:hypothetical protein
MGPIGARYFAGWVNHLGELKEKKIQRKSTPKKGSPSGKVENG